MATIEFLLLYLLHLCRPLFDENKNTNNERIHQTQRYCCGGASGCCDTSEGARRLAIVVLHSRTHKTNAQVFNHSAIMFGALKVRI